MASSLNTNFTGMGAADALGLGGQLGQQVQDETDEERKKRLRLQQQQTGPGSALGAVESLFGRGTFTAGSGNMMGRGFNGFSL